MKFVPHDYQRRAIEKALSTPFVALFLEMGLGKSVIALTVAESLLSDFAVSRVLVIAPLKVAEDTWSREVNKWDHLMHLRVSKILGDAKKRKAAVEADADIYVINRENVPWLVKTYSKRWKWDMLIIDELSSFKSPKAQRFKALKSARFKFSHIIGLTGTPNPNGLMDLWAQIYLIDGGERLGKTIGTYRREFFTPGRGSGYVVYNWVANKDAEAEIPKRIEDIAVSMKAADYLELPKRIDNTVHIQLADSEMDTYRKMERDYLAEVNGTEISALSAAATMGKLLQLSGGAVYDSDGNWVYFHDAKIKALSDIADTTDENILIFYNYKHEKERLFEYFKSYKPKELKSEKDIADWNAGKVRMLIVHPASVGYGLNLQDGGRIIVWYSLTWSLELYQQANARLYRQGQTKPVIIHHLIANNTVDEQVMRSLARKDVSQEALMAALKERKHDV